MKKTCLAVRYHETGKPEAVLGVESLPRVEIGPGQARVALKCAVINPSDLGMIGGSYGRLQALPAVAGREGVGEVVELGAGVEGPGVGTRVRMPEAAGVWQSEAVVGAQTLQVVPENLPLEQAAMAFINPPTALRLLSDFSRLEPGDWLVQNAGNSAVGVYVAQLARKRGLQCLSLVRDPDKWRARLKAVGATAVVEDTPDWPKQLAEITGGARPRLGLNSVGGESVTTLIKAMADGSDVVTFGGMVGDKVRFPTRYLIFNDVRLRGFWLDRWMRTQDAAAVDACLHAVYALIAEGVFAAPVAERYPLSEALEAVQVASAGGRDGKVLLVPDPGLG
ncbi:MAG: zinc-dependent alcohol dehydrogenase family protein [Opitutales bacterium]